MPVQSELGIHYERTLDIAAPARIVWEVTLDQLGPSAEMHDGSAFPMKIEARPGGRWFRDLGTDAGHLWGHVQVIKPPTLLEICGPLFMSYPAMNWVQYRFIAEGDRTRLKFTHQALGLIKPDHAEGVSLGWGHWTTRIKERAESCAAS